MKHQKDKNASRNQSNQNFTAVGPPHPSGASKTMPEQHDGHLSYAKASKSTRNVQNPLQQQPVGMQKMSGSSFMTEDISNMKDLQL